MSVWPWRRRRPTAGTSAPEGTGLGGTDVVMVAPDEVAVVPDSTSEVMGADVAATGTAAVAAGQNPGIISTGPATVNIQQQIKQAKVLSPTVVTAGASVPLLLAWMWTQLRRRESSAESVPLTTSLDRLAWETLGRMQRAAAENWVTPGGAINVPWRSHDNVIDLCDDACTSVDVRTRKLAERRPSRTRRRVGDLTTTNRHRPGDDGQGNRTSSSEPDRLPTRSGTGSSRRAVPRDGQGPAGAVGHLEGVVTRWYEDLYAKSGSGVLVVVGGRGSGKTSSLLLLSIEALQRRASALGEDHVPPVPVWVSCGSWDPRSTPPRKYLGNLGEHVAALIARDYPNLTSAKFGGPERPRELVRSGQLALFLDGLDEMAVDLQKKALDRIFEYVAETRATVVLTCRSEEWPSLAAEGRYPAKAVVDLLEIPPREVGEVLRHRSAVSDEVVDLVVAHATRCPDTPVARVLKSPLGLSLILRQRQQNDLDLRELLHLPTKEDVYDRLYQGFVRDAYAKAPHVPSPTGKRRIPADTERCEEALKFLACHLHRTRKVDIEWWALHSGGSKGLSGVVVGVIVAIAAGVDLYGVGLGIGAGVLTGLGVAILAGRRSVFDDQAQFKGIMGGVVGGICGGMSAWLASRLGLHPFGVLQEGLAAYLPGPFAIGTGLGVFANARGAFVGGLAGGFVSSLIADPAAALGWQGSPLADALGNGAAYGIAAAVAVIMFGRRTPARRLTWSRNGIPSGVVVGLAALAVGSPYIGLTSALPVAAAAGVNGAIALGFVASPGCEEAATARLVLERDRKTFLKVATTSGAGLWIATFAVHAPVTGVFNFIAGAAWVGFFKSTWGSFVITCVWLRLTNRFPVRVLSFLEDAHGQGILRQHGTVYRFAHRELQDHLYRTSRYRKSGAASDGEESPSPATSPRPGPPHHHG